jgi:hypothetical protein
MYDEAYAAGTNLLRANSGMVQVNIRCFQRFAPKAPKKVNPGCLFPKMRHTNQNNVQMRYNT